MKLYLTGGSGFVGRNLIRFLTARGRSVRALSRSKESFEYVERLGAEGASGDITDKDSLIGSTEGCDVVIHSAAKLDFWGPKQEFYDINVQGTRNLLEESLKSGVKKFIYISAASVVNGKEIRGIDETYKPDKLPRDHYSKTKALAEEIVLEYNQSGFETMVLRPPAIWGPDNPHYETMGKAAKEGKWIWVSGGKHTLSTIHVDNLCAAVSAAIENGWGGEVYFVTDGEDRQVKQFFTSVLNAEGIDPGERSVNRSFALALAYLFEYTWNILPLKDRPPLVPMMIYLMGTEFSVKDDKARKELGYENIVSIEEGLRLLRESH